MRQTLLLAKNIFINLLLVTTVSSCALFGGGASDDDLTHAKGFELTTPESWNPIDHKTADQAYRLPSGSIATMNSSCTRKADTSLELLTRHLMIGARNVQFSSRERIAVDGAEGLHSSARASYEGVPMHLELFVLTKSGCIFDFSLMNNKTITDGEVRDFARYFKSLRYAR